jgi:diguanylate cyclase (GGDEF)-like protein
VRHGTNWGDAPGRTWSLRREWSRAFAILLVLLLLAGTATFVGVRQLVGQLRTTAQQLEQDSTIVLTLRTDLITNALTAHKLLAGLPVSHQTLLGQENRISREFSHALRTFPASRPTDELLERAATGWRQALTKAGLWGAQLTTYQGAHDGRQVAFETDSDGALAILAGLEKPSLDAVRRGLAHSADLERALMATLAGLFGLALAATVYFRRRMTSDLVRPVATIHQGVLKLQAGDFAHRIAVARRDELGELADAFNSLAGALHESHLALTREATHDSLTGLPNRCALTGRLEASFAVGADRRARHEGVLFIDVDDFKDVNDSLGHEGGDALLVELSARLNGCVRPSDLVARLGGDEFAIVVTEDNAGSTAVGVAERILEAIHRPFIVGDVSLVVSVSIGVAVRRPDIDNATELLRRADFAMYMAKGGGKGRYQSFDAAMHDTMVSRSALKTDLGSAVAAGQLLLEYQPVADLRTGEVLGLEALVRWQHPTLGLLPPADFITLAEETGDIEAIGTWVLETATRQVAVWRNTMDHCARLWVAVNLSLYQLPNPSSLAAIRRILSDPVVRSENVVLEVTETALASDVDGGIAKLTSLKGLGVRLAIDDFGTGFSSLSTLATLPIDILKIDRAFVSGNSSGAPSVPMLEGILGLAAKLGLDVIAEGIEEPDQLVLLRDLGCFTGQGYLLGRPARPAAIEALLASGGLVEVTARSTL